MKPASENGREEVLCVVCYAGNDEVRENTSDPGCRPNRLLRLRTHLLLHNTTLRHGPVWRDPRAGIHLRLPRSVLSRVQDAQVFQRHI